MGSLVSSSIGPPALVIHAHLANPLWQHLLIVYPTAASPSFENDKTCLSFFTSMNHILNSLCNILNHKRWQDLLSFKYISGDFITTVIVLIYNLYILLKLCHSCLKTFILYCQSCKNFLSITSSKWSLAETVLV